MITRTKRPVTIHDVAKKAGVAFKTVSRVLNNETSVTPETQEKVRRAIKALDYSPSLAARVLAGSRSFLIGLLYDTPSSYYIHSVQIGALERCRKAGFHVILEHCNSEARNAADVILGVIKNTRMDGVILTPPLSDNQEILDLLASQRVPHVVISPPDLQHDTSCVHMDNRRAAFDMTSYLLSLGHKRIAFIKGHPRHGAAQLRFQGYQDALKNNGLQPSASLVKEGNFRFQTGVDAAEHFLRQTAPPTAIFAANDEMAAGALAAAHRMGYAVPDALSVVGFDDIFYAAITWPALTTVRQPIAEMGDGAAGLLLGQILSKKDAPGVSSSISFKYELKIRDSAGLAPKSNRQ
jgi:LacI family transcriptional regulator